MRFLQGVPKAQKSTSTSRTLYNRARARAPGRLQSQDVDGFSMTTGTLRVLQSENRPKLKRAKAFPRETFRASAGLRPGSPRGCSALRRGGGPLGRLRALDIDWHGVAIQTPNIILPRIHPRTRRCTRRLSRSAEGSCMMSSSKHDASLLKQRRTERDQLPLPLNTSSITGLPDEHTNEARSRKGRRQSCPCTFWRRPGWSWARRSTAPGSDLLSRSGGPPGLWPTAPAF